MLSIVNHRCALRDRPSGMMPTALTSHQLEYARRMLEDSPRVRRSVKEARRAVKVSSTQGGKEGNEE